MGIKGIFRELGPGQRISLAKLTADSFEASGRPYRIAVDAAIWQYQNQAARGGTNPAIRTLFYRLVRLLGTPVQPVFVFDGPQKPAFKRNKRSGRGNCVADAQAKNLIRLFGFTIHNAPGEAEAECALLQKHGIVDAVLSEDVDTIMFGCTKTLRNWSAEVSRTSKTPTHVSLYHVHDPAIAKLGLDREGMVLVALMSGGDYHPAGIPGCGPKVALEAAKAGFGKTLCSLRASDEAGMQAWRDSLAHELRTNEKGYFRTKHGAMEIPQDFPSIEILRNYTHPVVSHQSRVEHVREELQRKPVLHLDALREFCGETLGWDFREGAIKFIRVLSPALLVHDMVQKQEEDGCRLVERISQKRQHFTTDNTPELRAVYKPSQVVPIDLLAEVDNNILSCRQGLALNDDDEFAPRSSAADGEDEPESAAKTFDVDEPALAWVLEAVAKKSIPDVVGEWDEAESAKAAAKALKQQKKADAKMSKQKKGKLKATADRGQNTLEQFFRISKGQAVDAGPSASLAAEKDPQGPARGRKPLRLGASLSASPPSQLESKQPCSPSSLQQKPAASASSHVVRSLPAPPRPKLESAADGPEAIFISSSPIGPTTSPIGSTASPTKPAAHRRRPKHGVAGSNVTAGTGQRTGGAALTRPAKGVTSPQKMRRPTRIGTSEDEGGVARTASKQASMDTFITRSPLRGGGKAPTTATTTTRTTTASIVTKGLKSDERRVDEQQGQRAPVAKAEPESPTRTRAYDVFQEQQPRRRSSSGSGSGSGFSPPGKRLIVPPQDPSAGFYSIVESGAEEREQSIAREEAGDRDRRRGERVRMRAVRWSDVAVIDLTGGE